MSYGQPDLRDRHSPRLDQGRSPGDDRRTRLTRRRYDRNAPLYDMMERLAETGTFRRWRARLWQLVQGEEIREQEILEVGVGTGRNLAYYPAGSRVTAIDLSPRMLERAKRRADALGRADVQLLEMDIEHTPFPDASFDAAVSTCVFCSVPDPVAGLCEIRRVLRPGGRLYMLEHVLSRRPVVRQLMQLANPLVVRIGGENINRDTRRNLEIAGFRVVTAEPLWWDIFWLFVAEK